jgi:hypothetical protein
MILVAMIRVDYMPQRGICATLFYSEIYCQLTIHRLSGNSIVKAPAMLKGGGDKTHGA